MTSSKETPILIDSDDDSDVEILREEKNEDLDVIFVSEIINIKDKTCSEVQSSIPKPDAGLNRSLSISSSLDVTLHLNDNPSVAMVTNNPPLIQSNQNNGMKQSDEHRTWLETTIGESLKLSTMVSNNLQSLDQNNVHLHHTDQLPLDLTSKGDYDDISDSSDEDSLSSSSLEEDDDYDDDDNGGIFNKVPIKTTLLSMPALTDLSYNSDGTSINCTGTDIDMKPRSLVGKSKSVHQETSCQIGQTSSLQQVPPAGTFNVQCSKASEQGTSQPDGQFENSLSASTTLPSCDTSDPSTSNFNKTIIQTSDNKNDNDLCFSNRMDTADKINTDADKLLEDLDFLNSAILNTSDKTHPKLCKVLSVPDSETSGTQMSGVKRTISEQNLRSKSEDKVLPPKKQTRYLNHQNSTEISHSSWGSEKCSHCQMSLLGLKVSRCLQGHPSCTTCLEEKVKVVLTGKAKETLHCLKPGCGSYFPLSELNHSLPKMVVDILETKLDDDYIDYIASMILKNATSSDDSAQNVTTQQVPDIQEVRKTSSVDMKQEKDKDLPDNWTKMDKMKTYEMVVLEPESQEYIDVVFKFHESMKFPIADIVKISRIQNPILWQYYSVKRAQMILENEGLDVEERQLFHGTQTSVVESICKKGFDWRVCGKNGTVYGQGSYFAVNSSYSHQYTDKGNRRGRLPRRHHSLMFKPPPAHSNLWCSLFQRQTSQPVNPFSVGPSVINQPSYFTQTSQQPPSVLGATQPASCIMHGHQIFNQSSASNQQTSDQNSSGAPLTGGNNINNQQSVTKTVVINPQGAISLHKNVPNNTNFGNPNFLGIPPQGTYGQPQVNTSLQGGFRPLQANTKGGSSQVNIPVQGGYGQPQVFFPSNSSNCNMYEATKQEEDKPLHKMILSRVLVGRFTGGNANLRKPPPLYPEEDMYGKCYDSCVDHISEPKIFVIFDSAQAYPEYLIEYHMMNE